MTNDTKSIGVTSLAYHTTMWVLVIAGLLGNVMVLVWRCSRKESRHSLLSVLIISLAFADLLFCCHFLLQEVMLANLVFGSNQENVTSNVTTLDKRLCLSTLFLLDVSANAIMLTAVAIALATFFSFRLHRYGNRIVIGFLAISWMYCLAFGGVVVSSTYQVLTTKRALDVNEFSLFVVYECTGSFRDKNKNPFPIPSPVIITTLNAVCSVVVAVVYIYLWCKIRKRDESFTHSRNHQITHFRIRLTIISGLNLLCWWTGSFLYCYFFIKARSVFHGTLSPVITEPSLLIAAATSAANPIIYTIASKRFFKVARRACRFFSWHRNEELLPIFASQHITHGEVNSWSSFCHRLCPCHRPPNAGVLVCHPESATENTEETILSEYEYNA